MPVQPLLPRHALDASARAREVASAQKPLLNAIAITFAAGFLATAVQTTCPSIYAVTMWIGFGGSLVYGGWCVWRMCRALGLRPPLWLALLPIPGINFLALLALAYRACQCLEAFVAAVAPGVPGDVRP